jgi:hypothetical protein
MSLDRTAIRVATGDRKIGGGPMADRGDFPRSKAAEKGRGALGAYFRMGRKAGTFRVVLAGPNYGDL